MACQSSSTTDKNTPETQASDTSSQSNPGEQEGASAKLIVKNEADYSPAFLSLLRQNTDFENFYLDGNLMVINGTDSAYFASEPPIGKTIVLHGQKEPLAITLQLKRINQTTVDYTINMMKSGKPAYTQTGSADISPFFFLGAESDEDDASGASYFATEFTTANSDCHTAIRIGKTESSRNFLGKLIKNCNEDVRDIDLDNFPTLREK